MKIELIKQFPEFKENASSLILKHEAENNLMISIISTIEKNKDHYKNPTFILIKSDLGEIKGAAIMTPPHFLNISYSFRNYSYEFCHFLEEKNIDIPGINGDKESVEQFIKDSSELKKKYKKKHSMRIYQLKKVIKPNYSKGESEFASEDDFEVLTNFYKAFLEEVEMISTGDPKEEVKKLILNKQLLVWKNDHKEVVSMACATYGDTPNGQRIGYVYTPKHERKKGYATSVVARLSENILSSGKRFCFLFTDLMNPTSNKIYKDIGYTEIVDFDSYELVE